MSFVVNCNKLLGAACIQKLVELLFFSRFQTFLFISNPFSVISGLKSSFKSFIVIDDHHRDGNHINGIIDLTDKGIGVGQWFL